MTSLAEKIGTFKGKRIVIVGDVVADQFLRGTISRVSREAPVFILKHDSTETLPGGAANAAVNVASLGGEALLVGVIGDDTQGEMLRSSLNKRDVSDEHLLIRSNSRTTTKQRVLAGQHYAPQQQVIRIDYEEPALISDQERNLLKERLVALTENADAVIVSDYGYGVVDATVYQAALDAANMRKIPILADSRFSLKTFPGATSATPNQEEAAQILGSDLSPENCSRLREQLGYEALLVTCGNEGMLLIERGKPSVHIEAVGSKTPVDVTGAGDTVIAVYAVGLAAGLSFYEAASIANHAGSVVVMKKGTASVSVAELLASLNGTSYSEAAS
ncbi:MAG: carbohydrate kinase [Acidobacteria bacterium]|nr:carbohydrate kinase [Acidobacteriota bacterium]